MFLNIYKKKNIKNILTSMMTGSNSSTVELDQGCVDRLTALEQTQSSSKSHGSSLDSGRHWHFST